MCKASDEAEGMSDSAKLDGEPQPQHRGRPGWLSWFQTCVYLSQFSQPLPAASREGALWGPARRDTAAEWYRFRVRSQ